MYVLDALADVYADCVAESVRHLCTDLVQIRLFQRDIGSFYGEYKPCSFVVLADTKQIDLMYLLDEGHLSDFSSEELVKLVKALFSDSPTRQKNIDKIRSANIAT